MCTNLARIRRPEKRVGRTLLVSGEMAFDQGKNLSLVYRPFVSQTNTPTHSLPKGRFSGNDQVLSSANPNARLMYSRDILKKKKPWKRKQSYYLLWLR